VTERERGRVNGMVEGVGGGVENLRRRAEARKKRKRKVREAEGETEVRS